MELLVTGAWRDAKEYIGEIEARGHRVHFLQFEREELPCSPDIIEGVICNGLFLYHNISNFTNLRYIQLLSAGYDRVPMEYISQHNIKIFNAGDVYSIPMSEFAIAGVLDFYKGMNRFRENQELHKWEKQRDLVELYGKTVCIFGCGNVGCACAKMFSVFGAHVIGVKKTILKKEARILFFKNGFEKICAIEEKETVLNYIHQSDVILSALPLTAMTHHFFNSEIFSIMKKNALFINISRGGVVETDALINALNERKIAGAFLDVFEDEPLNRYSELWDIENVILTPHNSYVGDGNKKRLLAMILRNIEGF